MNDFDALFEQLRDAMFRASGAASAELAELARIFDGTGEFAGPIAAWAQFTNQPVRLRLPLLI